MPSRQQKRRAKRREEYIQNQDDELESSRVRYNADPEKKRVSTRDSYRADPEKKRVSVRDSYIADPEKKKASAELDRLNKDCNMTAGLEAELKLAVGVRVMLRRNLDTSKGLVNGALGTINSIGKDCIHVKFNHNTDTHFKIERVRSKFQILRRFYVYRKQFPVILAFAVTIHKCQGLSLDCAIVDLSSNVFATGMAYVALSRVRTLTGLHLLAFDPKSIKVSRECIEEVNRLRKLFRSDIPSINLSEVTELGKGKHKQ